MSLSYMREYAIMKNAKFEAATQALSIACWEVFLELHAKGKPLPEGMSLKANGTGYYDGTVHIFKGMEVDRNVVYSTVCPNTQRRVVIVPLKAFTLLKYKVEDHLREDDDAVVIFERYTAGYGAEVLIEQLTQSNNANTGSTLQLASLLNVITDFM